MPSACDEMVAFVTSGPTLYEIIRFHHSDETLQRVVYLIEAEAVGTITDREVRELKRFYRYEYFVDELKKRARRRLSHTNEI
ncbi:MAG: hypothetical protein KC546_00440 [Anaerolineae bacterium]|nr:hypothetical protein [Anaerolineae bacterium]MCA9886798.1 hypothetical protein [Anaerolineae bacterium]MCA9894380.1 hypothetical protein [Anaerolineae bacterium]MCB9461714.1 hypothetical protein [Anaerolineaceae bacterium]